MPSIKREGLSRSLIEAMIYRRPCIATDCGGSPELIVDGEPQIQIQPRDVDVELTTGSHEARLTVRLPEHLKTLLEHAAGEGGDSVNTYVVNTLASKAKTSKGGRGNRIRTSLDL